MFVSGASSFGVARVKATRSQMSVSLFQSNNVLSPSRGADDERPISPSIFFLSIIVLSCHTNRSTKQTHPHRAAADADVYDDEVSVNRSIRILRS